MKISDIYREVSVSGLIQGKIIPVFLIIIIGKRPVVVIVSGLEGVIAVQFFHIQGNLPPVIDKTGTHGFGRIAGYFSGQRPYNRERTVAGDDIAGQILPERDPVEDRHEPGKAQRIHKPAVCQIVHAAVQLLLIEFHVRQYAFLPFGPIGGRRAVGREVGPQVGLVNGEALLDAAVSHAAEHALHLWVVGLLPALAVSEGPVGIAQPEERRPVLVGEMGAGGIGLQETVAVDGQRAGIGRAA